MDLENIHGTGIPGDRDPEAPCDSYDPRRFTAIFEECIGDGHYLCKQCIHWVNHEREEINIRE